MNFIKNYLFSKYGYDILFDIRKDVFKKVINDFDFISFTSEKQGYIITLFQNWLTSIAWFLSNVILNTVSDAFLFLIGLKKGLDYVVITYLYDSISKIISISGPLIILVAGSIEIIKGNLTIGLLISMNSIVDLLYAPIERIVNSLKLYQSFKAESVKLFDFINNIIKNNIDLTAIKKKEINKIKTTNKFINKENSTTTEKLNLVKNSNISSDTFYKKNYKNLLKVKNLYFSYKNNFLNKNKLNKGDFIAIAGDNGSGKSTLINILCGLIEPDKGFVKFKDVSIFENLQNYNKYIGYTSLNNFFYNASILENILIGRQIKDKDFFNKILKITQVDRIIENKKDGLNFKTCNNGNNLSGGEKQKIALARALLLKPEILIIDEGTSNINSEDEEKILREIRNFLPELAIIMVSHRLSILKYPETIYVLHNGKIEEQGNFDFLISKKCIFYNLYKSQIV